MPLTEERRGLFRARLHGNQRWILVDPSMDAAAVEAEWRTNFAAHNEPWLRRFARWTVGTLVFVAVATGSSLAAHGVGSRFAWATGLAISFAAILTLGGIALAILIATKLIPVAPQLLSRIPGALAVPLEVVMWAAESTTTGDLWELTRQADRREQAHTAASVWFVDWDPENGDHPRDIIHERLAPILDRALDEETAALLAVAERVGFDVPAEMLEDYRTGLSSAP